MNKLRIGKVISKYEWFKTIDTVDALYKDTINIDGDCAFPLELRDFLVEYNECSQEMYESLTVQSLMQSLDLYTSAWGSENVIISEKDRCKGVGLFGPPGSGKSVTLLNFCNQDLMLGMCGLFLIDPSGTLAREVYSLAKAYKRDVTYLCKENPCIGLNIMAMSYSKEQRAELVIAFLNHITITTSADISATTRMRNTVYEEVIWCIDNGRPRLNALLDRLRKKKDPKNQYAIDGVVSRLESILSDPAVEKILCSENAVNPLEFADKKKVLIVDTFGFGDLPSVAIGSALTFLVRDSFLAVRREECQPLALYIDEAHLFVNETFFHILKMARKFKIFTTLATQDFATIPQTFKHVMLSNIGTLIALNAGMRESREIAQEFRDMDERQLKFTDDFNGAVKTPSFEGVVAMDPPPFVNLLPIPTPQVEKREMWFTSD